MVGAFSHAPEILLAEAAGAGASGTGTQRMDEADQLLKGNRSVLGKVDAVTSDQIKVNIGEVHPRFLPLKQAKEKGFPPIKEGHDLIIVVNGENLLVDFHPLDAAPSNHTIIRGQIDQNLPIGQDRVVIMSGGKDQSFFIRSQARSKVAAIPVGTAAIFLLDETNQVADATFANPTKVGNTFAAREEAKDADKHTERKSPIKGAHKRVGGRVTETLTSNRITIRTDKGSNQPYEVRELMQQKIAGLQKGDAVILLIDNDEKVIDVAIPPPAR
ncbi:MAG: exported protein of unknown function [Nitrospira sp.]|nr:exported protein of unknown function [Nitrospira sp.]